MDLFRVIFLSLVQCILFFGLGLADDDIVPDSATPVKFDFAQWCRVGGHTYILEKTTLADVIRGIGRGVIHNNGRDAAEHEFFVDYTENGCLIRFSSNGEMGGHIHDLEEVEIMPLTADEKAAGLPPLRLPVTFQFGSVGMSFSDLVAALGQAVKTHGIAWYEYSDKVFNFDVLGTLKVKVVAGKVVAIDLTHVTSS